jgi:hypothetical protein
MNIPYLHNPEGSSREHGVHKNDEGPRQNGKALQDLQETWTLGQGVLAWSQKVRREKET